MTKKKGFYIVFEGLAGCGKSTQSKLLVEKLKKRFPKRKIIWTREPGGTEIADAIRKVVQGTEYKEKMNYICEQYLYAASRAQTLRTIVKPILDKGGIVVSDRSFFTSMAIQGFGRDLGIPLVLKINEQAIFNMWPDLVIYLEINIRDSLNRTFDKSGDKFEKLGFSFYKKVKHGYSYLANKYPKIVKTVDGTGTIEEVSQRIDKLWTKYLS
ncbi:MAG: dTMP kinase [Candidatus Amesbacteria bacterium]|nr:dTMP kinase [Candidatus Amesbacteria bacterium]